MARLGQLALTHPEHVTECFERELARIHSRAVTMATALRAAGFHARAAEYEANRAQLIATLRSGFEHTPPRTP